jgi:hypothetical protein
LNTPCPQEGYLWCCEPVILLWLGDDWCGGGCLELVLKVDDCVPIIKREAGIWWGGACAGAPATGTKFP